MKYFLQLAYKGTHYHGWQRQPLFNSVQAELETALEKMLHQKIHCIGCGRTDAGVHASQFFCHIKIEQETFDYDPVFRLNKILPDDISVFQIIPVDRNLHAQHDALSRTYTYRIHTFKNPFLAETSAYYPLKGLNTGNMKQALDMLPHFTEYRGMCIQPDVYRHTQCQISEVTFHSDESNTAISLTFTADRFLRGMVRILVAQILEIGYGRQTLEEFESCLQNGTPPKYFKSAHPQGLYLSHVSYPDGVIDKASI